MKRKHKSSKKYSPTPHSCPVCSKYTFQDKSCHDICPYCGWEDDGAQDDIDIINANYVTFHEYKARYEKLIKENPKYKWKTDKVMNYE